jgi:hypothetical protein
VVRTRGKVEDRRKKEDGREGRMRRRKVVRMGRGGVGEWRMRGRRRR